MAFSRARGIVAAVGFLSLVLSACGDDPVAADDAAPPAGDAPGAACVMAEPFLCQASSTLCFAVGTDSSCERGGLCAGDQSGMTCAFPCTTDADCAEQSATAVCFHDCLERLFDGQCVEPDVGAALLSFEFCETAASPRRSVSGSSG